MNTFSSAARPTLSGGAPAGLEGALTRALSLDGTKLNRLSYARTSVRFSVPETGDAATLLLDRRPPAVADGDQAQAEIEIQFTAEQAERFVTGTLALSAAVCAREVHATGDVRKYLEVDVMLRHRLAAQAGTDMSLAAARDGSGMAARAGDSVPDSALMAIETQDLRKSFGKHEVLCGTNLMIPEGVISVILGPSGTGKSVLLRHVIGLLKPDAGDVLVRGRRLSAMSHSELMGLRRGVGVMFQDGALFSTMDLFDNVAFPLRQHTDYPEREIREIVMHYLAAVGLTSAVHRLPNELSGGMRKRAGLARALVLDPGIVLCDEPDSGLDPVRTALLGELIAQQHAEHGGTVVVITHNVMLANLIADHISILWQGTVVDSGTAERIRRSEHPLTRQLLGGESQGPLGMDAT